MTDINKIIRVLDLSQSDARDGTLDGIVKFILYSKGEVGVEQKFVAKAIEKELTIVVHEQDVNDSIYRLIDAGFIEKMVDGNLKLSTDENYRFRQESLKINENRNSRQKLFNEQIEKIAIEKDYAIEEVEIKKLWEIFRTFIYDCYLTHGKNAIDSLTKGESENDENVKSLVNKYLKETENKKLKKILAKYIKIYPEIIDSNILEYLRALANKTESFYSLGLSQKEYKKLYEDLKFDWIVFVDTNFIYSILDLHNNPEKQSAKFLLELGTELGIKFKYTSKTFDELNTRKNDFEKYLEKDLKPSQISALLKSGKLDDFAESYYEKLLEDRVNTPHPSEIIVHSQNSMKEKKLVLYNSKFDAVTKNEDYLLDQESAFNSYLKIIDEARQSKGFNIKGPKDAVQVQHDIFLREVILHLRSNDVTSISSAKYFGVTLDKTLIKFDLNQLKRNRTSVIIPTFFKPSILLKKLLRQAPLKTKENYLRAFISTISTPAIDENSYSSKIAIRSLKYFHKMGIDNEKLILDCLKDELFLKSFEKKESNENDLEKFVESEINKQISIKTKKIEDLETSVDEKNKRLDKVTEYSSLTKEENIKLSGQANELKRTLDLYNRELKKLKKKTNKVEDKANSLQLNIYNEKDNIKADIEIKKKDDLNKKLFLNIKESRLKSRRIKGYLLAVLGLLLLISIFLIYFFIEKDWNYMTSIINKINGMDDARRNISYGIAAFIIAVIDVVLFQKVNKLLFSKKSKLDYIKEIETEFLNNE